MAATRSALLSCIALFSLLGLGVVEATQKSIAFSSSYRYLIASFPTQKQVAYLHLPDNVWRPLVVGTVSEPRAVAVDALNSRLFVADKQENKIFWYNLFARDNGLLQTDGNKHVAVEGFTAFWMAVNGVGDLYFTGKQIVAAPAVSYDAVFRQDALNIATGDTLHPVEVYTRSNSGIEPEGPKVYMPSGIAVDSFHIFWGNQDNCAVSGSVVKGSRKNIGAQSDMVLKKMNNAHTEVRGLAITGNNIYYLAKDGTTAGVYGMPKVHDGEPVSVQDEGQIVPLDPETTDTMSIAWDGDHTLYFSDTGGENGGTPGLYSLPDGLTPVAKPELLVEAPGIYGVAVLSYAGEPPAYAQTAYVGYDIGLDSGAGQSTPGLLIALAASIGILWALPR